jgi:hypothetical protein
MCIRCAELVPKGGALFVSGFEGLLLIPVGGWAGDEDLEGIM